MDLGEGPAHKLNAHKSVTAPVDPLKLAPTNLHKQSELGEAVVSMGFQDSGRMTFSEV